MPPPPPLPLALFACMDVGAAAAACALIIYLYFLFLENWNGNPKKEERKVDAQRKRVCFKQFDTAEDCSDHHFYGNAHSYCNFYKSWTKTIVKEWEILEKHLPETIFVRAYESRMDLMRAAIIGADSTPYHDGIFFFNIMFPSSYPNEPPALILNSTPYLNEPGNDDLFWNKWAWKSYNEEVFILSIKTMICSINNPPKHFEGLVTGHFLSRGIDILKACRAYSEGTEVGSDIFIGKIRGSNSTAFESSLAQVVEVLTNSLIKRSYITQASLRGV